MSRFTDGGYKPAKSPIRTDEVTYKAVIMARESFEYPTTIRAIVREAVRSRFPEQFAEAERQVAAETSEQVETQGNG